MKNRWREGRRFVRLPSRQPYVPYWQPVIRVGAASKDLEVATLPGPGEIVAAVRSLASG